MGTPGHRPLVHDGYTMGPIRWVGIAQCPGCHPFMETSSHYHDRHRVLVLFNRKVAVDHMSTGGTLRASCQRGK